MRASEVYELRHQPAPVKGQLWRRLAQLVALVTEFGPVPGGGEHVLIIERTSGNTLGSLRQRFADEFYAVGLEEDLLTLSAEEFQAKWLLSSD